jgi:signal transduction histidine kinase
MFSHLDAVWPLVTSMALALTVRSLRVGRRRTALNEAMHELRRPLQAIALAAEPGHRAPVVADSIDLATAALERLDREINGGTLPTAHAAVCVQALVRSAVARWKARAALVGGSLELRWPLGSVIFDGDPAGLAQALDNLIVNAIEHGGPAIVVEGRLYGGRLCVSVADSGRGARSRRRRGRPAGALASLTGRRRHGHGLAVVRRVATAHGGDFAMRSSRQGSVARLELPLRGSSPAAAT